MKRWLVRTTLLLLGISASLLFLELAYRLYHFGPSLQYPNRRAIDPSLFPQDRKHLFFVGDGFSSGYPAPIDLSYSILFEQKLKDPSIQVTNFSRRGSSTLDQMRIIYQIAELKPDLLVWGLSSNDLYLDWDGTEEALAPKDSAEKMFPGTVSEIHPIRSIFLELPYECLFVARMDLLSTVKEILQDHSYLYIQCKLRFREHPWLLRLTKEADPRWKAMKAENVSYYTAQANLSNLLQAISHIQRMLTERGIGFVLLYVPEEYDVDPKVFQENLQQLAPHTAGYNRLWPRQTIRQFCAIQGIQFLDPSDELERELAHGQKLFISSDGHYNYAGNARMAEFLANQKEIFLK